MGQVFEAPEYRRSLAAFATGVAIVTTTNSTGDPVGLTVNSFASVSLAPPLILWSLRNTSPSLAAFERAEYFAVNVLTADQQELSHRFSSPHADRFGGMMTGTGYGRVPLIEGCATRLECIHRRSHREGDHVIFIGEVLRHWRTSQSYDPLIFCDGAYKSLREIRSETSVRL